ncbi:MAG: MarR family winged helix-turn-helix transcriptional regulator [Pseudomonadales bacterium]|nr:MarR family winged helix-turn-helix transcriptional regulator [Pseudomonadales bacterium]NRA17740.1 winged helix-turn-helix transcriptional regulator [Oceanospirillaceae bacterium]
MAENDQTFLDLQQFFPYQFSILAGQISDYIAKIYRKEYGLTKFEWRVLATVGQHGQISASAICQFTQLDKMQASRAIGKLTKSGSLQQQISETDRRTNLLQLTETGQQMYLQIVPLVKQQEQLLLSGLTPQERQQLMELTQKLSRQLVDKEQ